MHRHGYVGRKLSRLAGPRRALIKGLATSLVENGKITTTLPKAKEVVPYVEDLITKAKKGDLHNRRQIVAALSTVAAAHKLVDGIAPKLGARTSGHLRIKAAPNRVGDNAPMAVVSFVDDITGADIVAPAADAKPQKAAPAAKKAPAKVADKAEK